MDRADIPMGDIHSQAVTMVMDKATAMMGTGRIPDRGILEASGDLVRLVLAATMEVHRVDIMEQVLIWEMTLQACTLKQRLII